jgi:hypothetical protein
MREKATGLASQKDRDAAKRAGRLAARTGKGRRTNPHAGHTPEARTAKSDSLRDAWNEGYDFENQP